MTLSSDTGRRLATCNALWIGAALGPLYAACLRSFVRHGHRVVLHTYDAVSDVPDGVEVQDANIVLDRSAIFRHRRTGSFAPFADQFRLELMRHEMGTYIDCDVFCVRELVEQDYLIGREDPRYLNNAVLRLPPGELLDRMLQPFAATSVASWVGPKEWLRCNYNLLRYGGSVAQNLSWGFTGPKALTHWVEQLGLRRHVVPASVLYPVHWSEAAKLIAPGSSIEQLMMDDTVCIHLCNEVLSKLNYSSAPKNSVVGEILRLGS